MDRQRNTLAVRGLEELFSSCAIVLLFWLWREIVFGFTSILRVQYMIACCNRYFEEMEDGQMTPRGCLKSICFGNPDGRRNISGVGFPHYVPPG
jgi:hypothetical protein